MLSVIIPARNEIYLEKTIRSVLDAAEGEIEILVILDGYLPDPVIHMNDSRVIFYPFKESIGQRAAVNFGAKVAKGNFIMKLDAHCSVDKGFDVKLAADCEYDVTMIPRMYNLDVEKWEPKWRRYHDYLYIGGSPGRLLRAEYYGYKHQITDNLIDDTMCCMGPGFFMHKDRFWELGGMDEGHGSWGQMGVELACKAWLSGGSMKVNKKTWFAHWFRGGGGPGFSYPISGKDVEKAREYSRDLWMNNKWLGQKRDFQWMLDKFNPPGWENKNNDMTILFYTANVVSKKIMEPVIRSLKRNAERKNLKIISISQEPIISLGDNIVVPKERSVINIYRQILAGAKKATTKYVALCEDDCLYTPDHFDYRPNDSFGYNLSRWNLHLTEGVYSYRERPVLSQCIAVREDLIRNIEERLALPTLEARDFGEFGLYEERLGISHYEYETFSTDIPNMVICHKRNISGRKYIGKDMEPVKTLPVWGDIKYWLNKLGDKESPVRSQHSHIASCIFDMDELYGNRTKYGDPRKLKGLDEFIKTGKPFFQAVHEGKIFTDDELLSHPYYQYLFSKLHPSIRDTLSSKGVGRCLHLMKDGIALYKDIKENGLRNPLDMFKMNGSVVLHRGGRRLEILKLLGYKKVPCRIFNSRELFIAHMPDRDAKPDNSIHGLAMQQFMTYGEKATDKFWVHSYTKLYDKHFAHLRNKTLKLLEIGVFRGASLLLWKSVFPNAEIFGLDKDEKWHEMIDGTGITVFKGRQEDETFIGSSVIPAGPFDIIIDDGGHRPLPQQASFKALWPHLNNGGLYVLEDLYGNYRPDRIKDTTMNMLKGMIDEMNIQATIRSMSFYYNICFVEKT